MATIEVAADGEIVLAEIPAETRQQAMRTVAAHATGAADCRVLLAMLGLAEAGEPTCGRCGQALARPNAAGKVRAGARDGVCGSCLRAESAQAARRAETTQCPRCGRPVVKRCRCARYVPIAEVRDLVDRIRRDTGKSRNRIARDAGLSPERLRIALGPSSRSEWIARATHAALLRLAQELGA